MADEPPPESVPLYDLDEIIANLTLEDEPRVIPSAPSTPTRPSLASRTVYKVSSPTAETLVEDWSAAGTATQRTPQTRTTAVRKARTPRGPKRLAYTVFRGRTIGVFDTWVEAEAATSGMRFALHQGYSTRQQAEDAFAFAQGKGWTCESATWTAVPVSSADAPQPVLDPTGPRSPLAAQRKTGDPWYVVYAGVNPGIFPTSLECALNVLGIKNALHEKVLGFREAREKFSRAREAGNVVAVFKFFVLPPRIPAWLAALPPPALRLTYLPMPQLRPGIAPESAVTGGGGRQQAKAKPRKQRLFAPDSPDPHPRKSLAKPTELPQFKEFLDVLVPQYVEYDESNPVEVQWAQDFIGDNAANPCTQNLPAHSEELIMDMYARRDQLFPEWRAELREYRVERAGMSKAELDARQLQVREEQEYPGSYAPRVPVVPVVAQTSAESKVQHATMACEQPRKRENPETDPFAVGALASE
ncbi:hypothetical protein B0H12DRAFT_1234256 [Mycena haematopus]|nr:hypothetical protein B0H12DRAFT_1234256 [Mycena haematopus]